MNVILLGSFSDMQTAIYIMRSFKELGHNCEGVDIRRAYQDLGSVKSQKVILKEIEDFNMKPDLILVLKGIELHPNTLKEIKNTYKKAKLVNWFFDVYLGEKRIYEHKDYFKTLEMFDTFFCSLKGVATKLNDLGFNNVKYLDEACYPEFNGPVFCNHYQTQKYGSDVAFVGSLGYMIQHPNRISVLQKIVKEGFRTKIWGNIVCDYRLIPPELKQVHTQDEAVNLNHSRVASSSLVNIGIDQDELIELGHSARLYRVLCAGGLYLCNYTKELEKMFNINMSGEDISMEQDLVVYYGNDDLVEKLDFLLEHDDIRKKISENGQKKVLEKHKFTDRIKLMMEEK